MAILYRLAGDFDQKIERAGLTKTEIARRAGISIYTILTKQRFSAGTTRKGRMRGVTAWKIARVFAVATNQAEDTALAALFVEDRDVA